MDLVENAILKVYRYPDFSKNHIIDWESAEKYTSNIIDRFDVKTSGLRVQIKSLSGGNLQRFILSRELSLNPRVIVAVHPSRGLDLESTSRVLGFLAGMKKSAGVLLITEDLDEAIKICDKILIIYKGRLSRPIPIRDLNYEAAGGMMAGAIPIEETS
jgi:simple sugar transport system ATP-binding protein